MSTPAEVIGEEVVVDPVAVLVAVEQVSIEQRLQRGPDGGRRGKPVAAKEGAGRDLRDRPFGGDGLQEGAPDAVLRGKQVVERERPLLDEAFRGRPDVRLGLEPAALALPVGNPACRRNAQFRFLAAKTSGKGKLRKIGTVGKRIAPDALHTVRDREGR